MTRHSTTWHRGSVPAGLPVKQVYGIISDRVGRILLLQDGSRFNLPGGKPARGETFCQTLQRECMEEAQVTLSRITYLGFVRVSEHHHGRSVPEYAQVRMVALLDRILNHATDPATGRTYARLMMVPRKAASALNWGSHGFAQIQAATDVLIKEYGITSTMDETVLNLEPNPPRGWAAS